MCGKSKAAEVKETPEQKELARIAAERWGIYKQMYLPAEEKYFEYVQDMNAPETANQVEGMAAVNVESAFGNAIQNDIAQLTSQSVDPTSGKFQAAIADHTEKRAEARTDNTTRTGQALQDSHVAGLQNIVAIGNNQAGQTVAGLGDVAAASNQEAISDAKSDYFKSQSNAAAIGQVAGAGYATYQNTKEG